jgi:hypothetical protein
MLTAGEPLYLSGPAARAILALGRATKTAPRAKIAQADAPTPSSTGDDLAALRAEYREKLSKNPFNGWDAATLREKIAAA